MVRRVLGLNQETAFLLKLQEELSMAWGRCFRNPPVMRLSLAGLGLLGS